MATAGSIERETKVFLLYSSFQKGRNTVRDSTAAAVTLPVGWEQHDASAHCRCHARGWEGRADTRMRSRSGWLRIEHLDGVNSYAAAALFAVFVGALTGGLGMTVFAAFAFSLAANSCLTVVVIVATSTL